MEIQEITSLITAIFTGVVSVIYAWKGKEQK